MYTHHITSRIAFGKRYIDSHHRYRYSGRRMISLKAFLPVLSRFLELSPAALYERQRALVRLNLLPKPTAPGRRSGAAMATPDSVAMMLIAVLATDNLSETDDRIEIFAKTRAIDPNTGKPGRCRFTGKHTFHEALAEVLSDSKTCSTLSTEVSRKANTARLINSSLGSHRSSEFGRGPESRGIELKASFVDLFSLSRELEKLSI
jgi:hypothetical protein